MYVYLRNYSFQCPLVHSFWDFAWALNLAKIMAVGCVGLWGNTHYLEIIHLQFINTLFINRVAIYDIIIVSKDNTQQTDRKDSTMKIKFPYVRIKAWKDNEKGVYQNA